VRVERHGADQTKAEKDENCVRHDFAPLQIHGAKNGAKPRKASMWKAPAAYKESVKSEAGALKSAA